MTLRVLLVAVALSVGGAACGGGDPAASPSAPPSGSLGPVTPEAAREAILGLCELGAETDRDAAAAAFADRSHRTLHVIAAAAEPVDRAVTADLLLAKQRVEADLAEPELPETFADDVETLRRAAEGALEAIGLEPAACGT